LSESSQQTKIVEVAAAVLQKPDGSFLLAQRPADKIWAGYWEFPGGKVEVGETPRHALVRELREELGIAVQTAYPWLTRVFTYPHATVRLHFFRVTVWEGELHPHEGQEFSWQRTNPPQPPFFKVGSGGVNSSEVIAEDVPEVATKANASRALPPFFKVGSGGVNSPEVIAEDVPEVATKANASRALPPFFKVGSGGVNSSEVIADDVTEVATKANARHTLPPFEKGGRRGDFAHDETDSERAFPYDTFNFSLNVSPVLPANAPILRSLELPTLYAISNAAELGVEEFMLRLETALHKGLRLVQLREKNISHEELRELAQRVVTLAHAYGARVLLNGDVALAQEVGADGVQLTGAQLAELQSRPEVSWCAASCHSVEELRRAEELGCDFVLLSPVLPTKSHPGAAHLGWGSFAEIAAGASIPVYALGGLTQADMETAWRHGAHGISLLRQAW